MLNRHEGLGFLFCLERESSRCQQVKKGVRIFCLGLPSNPRQKNQGVKRSSRSAAPIPRLGISASIQAAWASSNFMK
jgi:hypothetical protein